MKIINFKNSMITLAMLGLSCIAFGQQIKNKNVELDDLISLLRTAGYELFNFDISEMLNERYDIEFIQKEYEAGKEIATSILTMVQNKMLLTDIPESYRQKLIDEGRVIDSKTQAISHAEKISFGFYPSNNDTTKRMRLHVPGFITKPNITFNLRGLASKNSDKLFYAYQTRPFKMSTFKENEFIPLVLLGSVWYDERYNLFRFCGEIEIDPDMSSEILKYVPHYYVVGVKFVKRQ